MVFLTHQRHNENHYLHYDLKEFPTNHTVRYVVVSVLKSCVRGGISLFILCQYIRQYQEALVQAPFSF